MRSEFTVSGNQRGCGRHVHFGLLLAAGLLLLNVRGVALGADSKTLPGHVPKIVGQLPASGRLAATNQLRLAWGVTLRDPAGLDAFLAQVSDPASPNYRHYLTPPELAARFGPTESDYEAVKAYARSNGLTVVATFDNRLVLDVAGPVAAVEKALHLTLRSYPHPTEGRLFFAPDADPTVAAGLPVTDIQGLSDFHRPHPRLKHADAAKVVAQTGSSPDGSGAYFGDDFRRAYVPGTSLTGAGQMVGLVQFDGFYSNDIAVYAAAAGGGRPNIPIQTVLLNGFDGVPTTSGNDEVSLDIELTMAMAPGLSKIVVFETTTNGPQNDLLNTMLGYSTIKQLSCSWGWDGGPSATTDTIFKNMAAAGQSFFDASGDSDAFTAGTNSANGVDDPSLFNAPSSSPFITQVGGTTLRMSGSGVSYASEKVWNWGTEYGYQYDGWGSSGGVSSYYSIPNWQTNISNLAGRGGSASFRNIPDVALTADNVYVVSGGGGAGAGGYGGTSCAAPLWAGFMALVNQQASAYGQPVAGFINPAIYAIATSSNYAACFHDVTSGNSTWSASPSLFSAQAGYDLCTGLGTPNGTALINALSGGTALAVSPTNGLVFFGPAGGAFYPASGTLQLSNTAGTPYGWSLINTSAWLVVSATNGSLAAGSSTSVVVSVSFPANSLGAAVYGASLVISNTLRQTVVVPLSLSVGQLVVLNGGFETGDFTDWILSGNTGAVAVGANDNYVHSGSHSAEFGPPDSPGYITQNLLTVPGQTYLLSFWLRNPTGGTPNQFQAQWNGSTLFSQTDITNSAWTNLQFLVVAPGLQTPLQFGFEDTPDYLALDDVSVTAMAPAVFRSVVRSANHFQLVWNTTAGLNYQVQYKTNLLQANWNNLGTGLAASTNTLTWADTNGVSDQRFYRLSVVPQP